MTGALLQAFAIHQALKLDPAKDPIDSTSFIDELLHKIQSHEVPDPDDIDASGNEYQTQLNLIKQLLKQDTEPQRHEVVGKLGHSIKAQFSVPTAIYSFLRSEKTEIKAATSSMHPFRNTLEYSITLGGDTDTIASMACAISGAYYGDEVIPKNLLKHCEDSEKVEKLANDLFKKVYKS